ncbi:MAG: metal ABC transporter permease [Spirochaetes bacterium]|nr:metal ABC transporter permease [Spirochaetota bacterium]
MGLLEKIFYYFNNYGAQLAMSIPYFVAVSLVGVFLILRRASLFGLVLSASSQLAFIVGMALHLISHESLEGLVMMQNPETLVADLFHMDAYLFVLLVIVMLPPVFFISRGIINTESVLAILFVFLMGAIPLANKIAGGSDILLLKAYFTEILYTPKRVFLHYFVHLAVAVSVLVLFFRKFLITGFDPIQGRLLGLPVEAINMVCYFTVGFVIALCVRVLGIYVTMMALISPGLVALATCNTLKRALVATISFSIFFSLIGFGISFAFDALPTEPTIIVVFGIALLLVWGGKKLMMR